MDSARLMELLKWAADRRNQSLRELELALGSERDHYQEYLDAGVMPGNLDKTVNK